MGMRSRARLAALLATLAVPAVLATAPAQASTPYHQINLVSDLPGVAQLQDPNLVNPWGLAFGPTTPAWVADNGTDVATIYQGGVGNNPISALGLVVNIPGGEPTGEVFNPTEAFVVHKDDSSGPAKFIFASESGNITGWNPGVPPPPFSTEAQLAAHTPDAIYKGLTLAFSGGKPYVYATDFHHNRIDVFDSSFTPTTLTGDFTDPNIPEGYAPFGIQRFGDVILVTYAQQDEDAEDDVPGPGHGFVDVFRTNGQLVRRLISRGELNSPWGLAIAPSEFGTFSHALLVGNFGNGLIHAYDAQTGQFLGTLHGPSGKPIQNDGLWALRFGNRVTGGSRSLLFTAGLDDEAHGLFGEIRTG